MKPTVLAAALASGLLIASAAQAMPVSEFLEEAEDIPMNPTALLRSDARRLMGELQGAFRTVSDEYRADRDAGRPTDFCPAEGTRMSLSPQDVLTRFRSIPASRRHISVTQAIREWMAERYPC
ncbi:hypothetical protein [Brevundimonas sp.]|uniref:hypothetical protein n=1 Tax=Brevundimonas sp. TaxID=1871086 RepID=UPI0025F356DC|nr:hypothetical protein [Brevundimonas sp.]